MNAHFFSPIKSGGFGRFDQSVSDSCKKKNIFLSTPIVNHNYFIITYLKRKYATELIIFTTFLIIFATKLIIPVKTLILSLDGPGGFGEDERMPLEKRCPAAGMEQPESRIRFPAGSPLDPRPLGR
jgi:hypothetical protein